MRTRLHNVWRLMVSLGVALLVGGFSALCWIALYFLLTSAARADAIAPLRWQIETSRPASVELPLIRGETVHLEPQYLSYGAALDLTGVTEVVLRYRSATMAAGTYYAATGSVLVATGGTVRVTWTPTNEAAASSYTYTIAAKSAAGNTLRGYGIIKLQGSVNGTVTNTPRVYSSIDWAAVEHSNLPAAPFVSSSALTNYLTAVEAAAMYASVAQWLANSNRIDGVDTAIETLRAITNSLRALAFQQTETWPGVSNQYLRVEDYAPGGGSFDAAVSTRVDRVEAQTNIWTAGAALAETALQEDAAGLRYQPTNTYLTYQPAGEENYAGWDALDAPVTNFSGLLGDDFMGGTGGMHSGQGTGLGAPHLAHGPNTHADGDRSVVIGANASATNAGSMVLTDGNGGVTDNARHQFRAQFAGGYKMTGGPIEGDGSGLSNVTATLPPDVLQSNSVLQTAQESLGPVSGSAVVAVSNALSDRIDAVTGGGLTDAQLDARVRIVIRDPETRFFGPLAGENDGSLRPTNSVGLTGYGTSAMIGATNYGTCTADAFGPSAGHRAKFHGAGGSYMLAGWDAGLDGFFYGSMGEYYGTDAAKQSHSRASHSYGRRTFWGSSNSQDHAYGLEAGREARTWTHPNEFASAGGNTYVGSVSGYRAYQTNWFFLEQTEDWRELSTTIGGVPPSTPTDPQFGYLAIDGPGQRMLIGRTNAQAKVELRGTLVKNATISNAIDQIGAAIGWLKRERDWWTLQPTSIVSVATNSPTSGYVLHSDGGSGLWWGPDGLSAPSTNGGANISVGTTGNVLPYSFTNGGEVAIFIPTNPAAGVASAQTNYITVNRMSNQSFSTNVDVVVLFTNTVERVGTAMWLNTTTGYVHVEQDGVYSGTMCVDGGDFAAGKIMQAFPVYVSAAGATNRLLTFGLYNPTTSAFVQIPVSFKKRCAVGDRLGAGALHDDTDAGAELLRYSATYNTPTLTVSREN